MSTSKSGREKRQHERVRLSLKKIWNLSEGGAYIVTNNPRRLGSKVYVEFRLGEEGPVFGALAKVVRVLHKPNPKLGEPAGMAVQFIEIEESQREHLRQYLEKLKEER